MKKILRIYIQRYYIQEGQRCPKRRVAQAAIRLLGLITFRNKLGHPVKVNVLDVLRNVKLVI